MAFLPNTPLPPRHSSSQTPIISPRLPPTMIRAPPRTAARTPTTSLPSTTSRPSTSTAPATAPTTSPSAPQSSPYVAPADDNRVFPADPKPRRRSKLAAKRPAPATVDHAALPERGGKECYYDTPTVVRTRRVRREVREEPERDEEEEQEVVEDPHVEEEEETVRKKRGAGEDSVRSYLHEIGEVKLLNAEMEVNLAREIAKLLELERVSVRIKERSGRDPGIEEWAREAGMELDVFRQTLRRGLRAKEHMVAANLRLVVSIAKKYLNRGLTFQDLIQEGSIGLIRGAEKFDGNKGFKFSTYATWWIRQAITRAIADHSRPIRLPVHVNDTIAGIKKATKILHAELHRPPSEKEIAERMDMTVEKLRFMAKSSRSTISLETPVGKDGKDGSATLGSYIMWDGDTPEENTMKSLLREDLENVLNTLSPRERDVVRMRYGLDDGKMKTLEEIGNIFAVTRERIRQIEAKALRKLRHPNRNAVLREYVYEDA